MVAIVMRIRRGEGGGLLIEGKAERQVSRYDCLRLPCPAISAELGPPSGRRPQQRRAMANTGEVWLARHHTGATAWPCAMGVWTFDFLRLARRRGFCCCSSLSRARPAPASRTSRLAPRTPAWPDSGCACLRLTGPARAGAERDLPRPRFFVAPPFASRAVTASVARGRRQPAQRAARGNLRHATRSSRSKRGRLQWVSISTPLDPPNQ